MITREYVVKKLNEAEKKLDKCFSILLSLKHADKPIANELLDFQPLLAECLYETMEFYMELQKEKDYIISKKKVWDENLFNQSITDNAKYYKAVRRVIEKGKNIGDAFAWLFYSNNREELDRHFQHPSTGLFVAGIGGRGEIEFIKQCQVFDGVFILYHGITSMLRIGDFSMFDFRNGIVGVGEIKTKREGDKFNISVNVASKIDVKFPVNSKTASDMSYEDQIKELEKNFPSIKKQLKIQDELLTAKKSEKSSNMYADYEYDVVNGLTPNTPFALNEDNSVLLFASWKQNVLWSDILLNDSNETIPNGFRESAQKLIRPGSPYNECFISKVDTQICPFRIPIFWWKISDQLRHDLYFDRVDITTVFNPANLMHMFIEDGFEVVKYGRAQEIVLEKRIGDKSLRFESLSMYLDLFYHSFMKPVDGYSVIKRLIEAVETGQIATNSKIPLNIHLHNFGKPNEQ